MANDTAGAATGGAKSLVKIVIMFMIALFVVGILYDMTPAADSGSPLNRTENTDLIQPIDYLSEYGGMMILLLVLGIVLFIVKKQGWM